MSAAQGSPTHVFLGGVVGFDDIATPANTALLRQAGDAGLYMHADAMAAAYDAGQLPAIAAAMAGTGAGEIEFGLNNVAAGFFAGWWKIVCLDNGLHPDRANVNADFGDPDFLKDWYAYVDAARAVGIGTLAPVFSPNGANASLADFATNPAYADIRTAALYGGALCIDAPPGFFLNRGAEYQGFVEGEIDWAASNGLRSTVIVAPYGDDATFLADTQAFVGALTQKGAVPTEWVVENYTPGDADGVGSDTQANSIAGVALWVALNAEVSAQPAQPQVGVAGSGTDPNATSAAAPSVPAASPVTAAPTALPATSSATPGVVGTDPAAASAAASSVPAASPAVAAPTALPATSPATPGVVVTDPDGHGSVDAVAGDTTIYSRGTDTIAAGGGLDVIYASGPSALVTSGAGTLIFVGGTGSASVTGGAGTSILYGGAGGGTFEAGTGGRSVLVAGSGNTTLVGGADGDVLFAAPASDGNTLRAGAGREVLVAGGGAATLVGASGSVEFAGAGSDTFRAPAGSDEQIVGFKPADRIVTSDGTPPIVATTQQGAWGTTLLFTDGTKVVLFGAFLTG